MVPDDDVEDDVDVDVPEELVLVVEDEVVVVDDDDDEVVPEEVVDDVELVPELVDEIGAFPPSLSVLPPPEVEEVEDVELGAPPPSPSSPKTLSTLAAHPARTVHKKGPHMRMF